MKSGGLCALADFYRRGVGDGEVQHLPFLVHLEGSTNYVLSLHYLSY